MAQLRPRAQSNFCFRIGEMKLHGVAADAAKFRDAAIRNAVPDEVDNQPLSRRQYIFMPRPSPSTCSHGAHGIESGDEFPYPCSGTDRTSERQTPAFELNCQVIAVERSVCRFHRPGHVGQQSSL